MNKIFYTIIFVFITISCMSQNRINDYKKGGIVNDTSLNKFTGVWKSVSGKDTFTLVLIKKPIYFKQQDITLELIIGWHEYKKDGKTIENYLNKRKTNFSTSDFIKKGEKTMAGSSVKNGAALNLIFEDFGQNIKGELYIEFVYEGTGALLWRLKPSKGLIKSKGESSQKKFKIPITMKFFRVE